MNLIKSEDSIPTWTLRIISEESQENLCRECWKVDGHLIYTHTHTQTHTEMFIYMCVCVCVCVYVCAQSFPHTERSNVVEGTTV